MLKNRATNEPYFVVIFSLLPKDQIGNAADQEAAQKDDKNATGKEVVAQDEDLD